MLLGDQSLDAETGDLLFRLDVDGRLYPPFFSPDGRLIAFRSGNVGARIVDGSSGELIRDLGSLRLGLPGGFSDDGPYLLVARGSSASTRGSRRSYGAPVVSIVDTESGEVLSRYSPRRATPAWRTFSFNAAGTRLAISEAQSSDLAIVDVRTGRELIHLPHESPLAGVGFHPDGNRLYTATRDGTITMWDGTPEPDESPAAPPFTGRGSGSGAFISRFDDNGDGKVSADESPLMWSRFSGADKDSDGALDSDEIRAGFEELRRNRSANDHRE
ncbi:MAG: hypothetical protein ACYTG0_27960 [Planctomycetota bacterium]|jgi:hypothetical protein